MAKLSIAFSWRKDVKIKDAIWNGLNTKVNWNAFAQIIAGRILTSNQVWFQKNGKGVLIKNNIKQVFTDFCDL